MNGLLWKEWRENRLIVVWAALLTSMLLIGAIYLALGDKRTYGHAHVDTYSMEECLCFVWFLSALLCSSAMVAPEVGSGSLQFLNSLPISRCRIWLTKLITCLGLLALAVAASTLVYVCVYALAAHAGITQFPLEYTVRDLRQLGPVLLVITLPLCAVGMSVTVLLDRPISALVVSIIASAVVAMLIDGILSLPGTPWYNSIVASWIAIGACVPVFLTLSYQAFRRDITLRTLGRLKGNLLSFLLSVVIVGVALAVAFLWILS